MDKKRRWVIEQNEISQVCAFTLGGVEQKVLIEGRHRELPGLMQRLYGGRF